MNSSESVVTTSIKINEQLLLQLRADAKAQKRSLGQYLETLLYDMGYRPYNEETMQAIRQSREAENLHDLDLSSYESFISSLELDEKEG